LRHADTDGRRAAAGIAAGEMHWLTSAAGTPSGVAPFEQVASLLCIMGFVAVFASARSRSSR
jgi:hypothetical protein